MTPTWWEGLILGVVQGLTEFLPISSSGHLVVAQGLLGYTPPGLYFEVALHLATLLSVFIIYRERIGALAGGAIRGENDSWRYIGMLMLASVPAAVAGFLLHDFFEARFRSLTSVGVEFLITAAILWTVPWALPRATKTAITPAMALAIGVAQAIAILPAISRSGATVTTALWWGLAPGPAAEFSFLMSIIVIIGGGLLEARAIQGGFDVYQAGFLLAFVAALVSGVFAIRVFIVSLARGRFHLFAPYCFALGIFTIVWFGILER